MSRIILDASSRNVALARKPDHEKRAQILAGALEIVREKGVHNATMKDIAEGLGMKRSSLYWYFKDLGELFDALLDDMLERQTALTLERFEGVTHPIDLLYQRLLAVHDFFDGQEDLILVLFQFWAMSSPQEPGRVIARIRERFDGWRKAAIALLEKGVEEGSVAPCDPEKTFDLWAAMVDGLLVHRISRGLEVKAIAPIIWERFLAPLKVDPESSQRLEPEGS